MSYTNVTRSQNESITFKGGLSGAWLIGALLLWVVLALPTLGLTLLIIPFTLIKYMTTEITVTTSRFIYKTGLISRHTNEISVRRIEGTNFDQGIIGRMLGYGTISVRGTGRDVVQISRVGNPVGLQRAINHETDIAR